jgi:hypothetical protein
VTIPTSPAGGIIFPVIATGLTGECKTIIIESGASVDVQTGGALNVKNP